MTPPATPDAIDTQEALQQLQALEQSLHAHIAQRNALQAQLHEIETAHKALEKTTEAYRIIGNIMVKADAATLREELSQKKESTMTRIAAVERQEKRLRDEMQGFQDKLLKE